MKKTRLLWILVIVLILINLALVSFIVFRKPPRPEGPKNYIIEKLDFNAEQITAYQELIDWHRNSVDDAELRLRDLKNDLYETLKDPTTDQEDSLIGAINTVQREIEKIHYQHFRELRELCTPEQIPAFNDLTGELARLFAPHPPHKE